MQFSIINISIYTWTKYDRDLAEGHKKKRNPTGEDKKLKGIMEGHMSLFKANKRGPNQAEITKQDSWDRTTRAYKAHIICTME